MDVKSFPYDPKVGKFETLHTESPWGLIALKPKSLYQKKPHIVWSGQNYDFLLLPPNEDWVEREGWEMNHCLSWLQREYAEAARQGEIRLYSMIDRQGKAVVDIELALTRGCGIRKWYKRPTVIQIRGNSNECPPAPEYIEDLEGFFRSYGSRWAFEFKAPNFDKKIDCSLFIREVMKRDAEKAKENDNG